MANKKIDLEDLYVNFGENSSEPSIMAMSDSTYLKGEKGKVAVKTELFAILVM